MFRGSGSTGAGEKFPPKIVHLFPQAFLNVLASFSVFFHSQSPARALGQKVKCRAREAGRTRTPQSCMWSQLTPVRLRLIAHS